MRSLNPAATALNPLQYMATADGWLDPTLAPALEAQCAEIAEQGFTAIQCSPPAGLTPQGYADVLAHAGLAAGPGYISLPWSEDPAVRAENVQKARRMAAVNAGLGSELSFLAMGMQRESLRCAQHAAIGFDHDAARMRVVIDYLGAAAEAVLEEGVVPALHPHVGTLIETESETRDVLEAIPSSTLRFGPDTGHLEWAGADVEGLLAEYRTRISGVHIKDLFVSAVETARTQRLPYRAAVTLPLWTEPGTGDVDFTAIFDALGDHYDGWVVIEVDRGNTPTPQESIRLCGQWFRSERA